MHEIKGLQARLLAFAFVSLVVCGLTVWQALNQHGWAVAVLGLVLIYISLRIGHTAREIAKVADRIEREQGTAPD